MSIIIASQWADIILMAYTFVVHCGAVIRTDDNISINFLNSSVFVEDKNVLLIVVTHDCAKCDEKVASRLMRF